VLPSYRSTTSFGPQSAPPPSEGEGGGPQLCRHRHHQRGREEAHNHAAVATRGPIVVVEGREEAHSHAVIATRYSCEAAAALDLGPVKPPPLPPGTRPLSPLPDLGPTGLPPLPPDLDPYVDGIATPVRPPVPPGPHEAAATTPTQREVTVVAPA
jgi:hypothetical protein